MMGNQEHEDFYHSLSRRELQALCKKHGLSANKTQPHLAKLLVSFFKRKNASPAPSEERSSGSMEVSPLTSSTSQLKPNAPLNSLEETNKGVHRGRVEASDDDSCGPSSSSKKEAYDMEHSQTVNQEAISSHVGVQTSHKVSDATANVILKDPSNNGITEGFYCSTSDTGNVDPHNPNCAGNVGVGSIPQIQSRNINVDVCPAESGVVSLNDKATEVPPASFQFFVESEDGINLYVDLNSSPSDWINSLKDEVYIYKKVHRCKSRIFHQEIRSLPGSDECMKTSSIVNTETGFQIEGVERNINSRCIRSSFCSIVRDNSKSSAIASNIIPVEKSVHVEEDKQAVSSMHEHDSEIWNPIGTDIISCQRDGERIPQDSASAFLKMDKSSDSVCGISINKSTGDLDVSSNRIGLKCSDPKTASIYPANEESGLKGTSIPTYIGSLEKTSGVCQGSSASSSMEMQSSRGAGRCKDSLNSCRHFGVETVLDCPMNDVQLEKEGLANCQPEYGSCSRVGNSDVLDLTLASPPKQGRDILLNEKESSECSQLDKACKRSHISEFPEELESKKQRHNSGDHDNGHTEPEPPVKNLRSAKNLARVPGLPRRSKRLVSK